MHPTVIAVAAAATHAGKHELVLQLAGDAPLAWLPCDRHVVVLLELLFAPAPPGASRSSSTGGCGGDGGLEAVLGWAAVSPFLRGGGSAQATLAEGPHQVCSVLLLVTA